MERGRNRKAERIYGRTIVEVIHHQVVVWTIGRCRYFLIRPMFRMHWCLFTHGHPLKRVIVSSPKSAKLAYHEPILVLGIVLPRIPKTHMGCRNVINPEPNVVPAFSTLPTL